MFLLFKHKVCGVPQKESVRRACLTMLTQSTAPGPSSLSYLRDAKKKKNHHKNRKKSSANEQLERQLSEAVSKYGLPPLAADRIRAFIRKGCIPLPYDIGDAIDRIQAAVSHLQSTDTEIQVDPRRTMKRFEDIVKGLNGLRSLVESLKALGIAPLVGPGRQQASSRLNRPLYISLDLGLRQRRKHFHGQIIFQCIAIPDTYFDDIGENDDHNNDFVLSTPGPGTKVAEGGRYDDLVRFVGLFLRPHQAWFECNACSHLRSCTTIGSKISPPRKFRLSPLQSLYSSPDSYGMFVPLL